MRGRPLRMRGATSASSCEVAPTFASFPWIFATRGVREEIGELQTTWAYNKGVTLPNERAAMERLLAVSSALRLLGAGVYLHGGMIAFSIIELLEGGYAMGHFAKCDANFNGLSHFLYQATACALCDRGGRLLNVQEDLGIEGLRTFKTLLRPVSFLKKYAVVPGGLPGRLAASSGTPLTFRNSGDCVERRGLEPRSHARSASARKRARGRTLFGKAPLSKTGKGRPSPLRRRRRPPGSTACR